ncbi:hypothetical protein VN97_g1327 [Penicillium thymicola]|uniref:Uncharacterized protein n=1 Tax=Penicillium thymicola TaxID=293382 RepID=A0AAI9XDB7_PENTH|nr:hypothetical protein VN97_g1327 [Penicillium thymicola]
MIDMGTTTWDDGPSNRKEMTLLYTPYVQSFAILHAKSNPEDVDLLSESQKRTIISSLAGYCVQEEWDVLMGLLPDLLRETILEVFLETLIYKEIFGRFFRAPFWYLDGKMSPSDEGDKTFSARLQYLYDRFYETNPLMAAFWRSETTRLSNATTRNLATNTPLGTQNRDRRESCLDQFVNDTLSSEPIKWLLKEPSSKEEEDKRYELLHRVYEIAAQSALNIGTVRGHLDFQTLATLPETYTRDDGWRMISHEYNLCNTGDRKDGRRILIVVYPGIIRRYLRAHARHLTEFSVPAYVVVERGPEDSEL